MYKRTLTVQSSLEARPAALFVQSASKFSCSIYVNVDDKTVNGKSIMGMISLGILDGQTITISAEGEDEERAVEELTLLF